MRLIPLKNAKPHSNLLKSKIYLISGLGADERVFQKLDLSEFEPVFIEWIIPLVNETIEQYATRLRTQITTLRPTLLGLSFGGMMAIEIAKQIETEKIILIASAKTKNEIPFYFRAAGKLGIDKFLPTNILKSANFSTNWFFGASSEFEKQLLKQIIIDTDPVFLRWAIEKIALWENQIELKNIFHIHGTNDKVLPYRFVRCDEKIEGGGHLMTLDRAAEITEIIRGQLLPSA